MRDESNKAMFSMIVMNPTLGLGRTPSFSGGLRSLSMKHVGIGRPLRALVALLALATCALGNPTHAQSCNPAVVNYIIRDESGKVLSEAELKSVYEQLPESIGDAHTYPGEVSFADDGKSFYRPESLDWKRGKKVPSLEFANAGTCTMHLTEATLTYRHKRMRLIFNIDITRTQHDRRPVIDSLPFQEGTFELDLSGWSHDGDKLIPAERWKKVRDKA